jgi:8-oxo-dGTP pyrophosphatase MutT (NUDIX family)
MQHDNACVVITSVFGNVLGVSRPGVEKAGGHVLRTAFFGLPGGKREGNETPQETAARELHEETGLYPLQLDYLVTTAGPGGSTSVFFCPLYRGTMRSSAEGVTSWCDWEDLIDGPFGLENRQVLQAFASR